MEHSLLSYEVAVMENRKECLVSTGLEDVSSLTNLLLRGKYKDVLHSEIASVVLGSRNESNPDDKLVAVLLENIENYMKTSDEESEIVKEYYLLCLGISCLQLFVQNNWVGPPTENYFSGTDQTEKGKKYKEYVLEELSIDAEPVYKQAKHHLYLLIAKTILLECRNYFQHCQTSGWWLMRCLKIHQDLLDEKSPTLKSTIFDLITEVSQKEPLMTDEKYRDVQIQFAVEAGLLCHFYYEPGLAKENILRAYKISGLQIELTGALGKRTKFQMEDKAQLVLQVTRSESEAGNADSANELITVKPSELPKDVLLDDDTILNEVKFKDDSENFVTELNSTEQALILALCHQHRRSHESIGKIIQEESMAYITTVLRKPQNWCVISTATLLRTSWESDSLRRSERSLTQLEELVTQYERPSENVAARLHLLYGLQLPPRWGIQKEQADFLMRIGAVKSALDVFLQLEMWEDVIKCYKQIGRTELAERVIREQLSVQETPSLWCHLGDVLGDPECYQKSWELSNCRYARAQTKLGYFYLYKAKFEESLTYFEKSLEINTLQKEVWFSYGCACLGCSKWENAVKAFGRCVLIDYDNFEAWNNLSTAYIKLKQKAKAFNSLQEALKCDYENWRVWENYLLVCTDIGQFAEAIRSYHRLIDLKDKYTDSKILECLVRAVNENMKDAHDNPAGDLKPKLLELFGRVTSKVTNDAEIWNLYAKLLIGGSEEPSQEDRQRALQYLQKSHRCTVQVTGWEKDVEKCKSVAEESHLLATTYVETVEKVESPTQAVQLLSSAKLMLKGTLTKIKQKHTDPVTKELLEDLREPCHKLEEELQKIVELVEKLKGR